MHRAAAARNRSSRVSRRCLTIARISCSERGRFTSRARFAIACAYHSTLATRLMCLPRGAAAWPGLQSSSWRDAQDSARLLDEIQIEQGRYRAAHADRFNFVQPVLIAAGPRLVHVTVQGGTDPPP